MRQSASLSIKCLSVLLVVGSVSWLLRSFSSELLYLLLQEAALSLAPYGTWCFLLIFTVSTILLAPAMILAMLSGICFTYPKALAITMCASCFSASIAFWITRFFGRSRLSQYLKQHRFAQAIDEGLEKDGWKCIVFTRISPFISFGLQNYLYGLSSIPFSIYLLTTGLAILPGACLYTYIGHLVKESVYTVQTSSSLTLLIKIPGYFCTLLFLYYVGRLISRAMKVKESAHVNISEVPYNTSPMSPFLWALTSLLICIPLLCIAQWPEARARMLSLLPGPPRVVAHEYFKENSNSNQIDHSEFSLLLSRYVTQSGLVDYKALSQEQSLLDSYLDHLKTTSTEGLGRDERLALYINAYNACTIRLILDHFPIQSIRDIQEPDRWHRKFCYLSNHALSLHEIEHTILRRQFREPRIHFALVCAAKGCAPLMQQAFQGATLEEQLEEQTKEYFSNPRWFDYDDSTATLKISVLLRWYLFDLLQYSPHLPAFVARYHEPLANALEQGKTPEVLWIPYDWTLNATSNAVSAVK